MYRLTRKAKAVRKRRHITRPDAPVEDQRSARWEPPVVRRVITIVDYDSPEPVTHTIELRRCNRIDCYAAYVDGERWHPRIGWSRVLVGLRKALPRLSTRFEE